MKPDVTPEVASNKNPMTRPLGKAIKTFRVGKRLTQKQLVDMIPYGVTQSYLSRIENGDSFPSNATVLSLVTALGCSTKELWLWQKLSRQENPEAVKLKKMFSVVCRMILLVMISIQVRCAQIAVE